MNALEDRLQHANSAVVLATVKVFLQATLDMADVHQQAWPHTGFLSRWHLSRLVPKTTRVSPAHLSRFVLDTAQVSTTSCLEDASNSADRLTVHGPASRCSSG